MTRRLQVLAATLLFTASLVFINTTPRAQEAAVSVNLFAPPPVAIAPPPLPVYVVPPPPVVGYIWSPGHWLWNGYGYFWVPGTWVQPPVVGYLWTPGYWGWGNGLFLWHEGYWGPHVGFYGGVNYGGGYGGVGFVGGRWDHGAYIVERRVINAPNITVVAGGGAVFASFNGGPGGTVAVASAEERGFFNERHLPPTDLQRDHVTAASRNLALAASSNHGRPEIAATARPGDFTHGVVAAREAGVRNAAAEQHNLAIKQNPSLAKGGAMPRPREAGASGNREGQPHPGNVPHEGAYAGHPPERGEHEAGPGREHPEREERRPPE